MPGRAHQASARLTEPASGTPLGAPAAIIAFHLAIPDGAATLDWTGIAGLSVRVLRAHFVKTVAASGNLDAATVQLQTTAGVAISDAINIRNIADQTVVRAGTINDASHTIAAGGGLRVVVVQANAGDDSTGFLVVEAAIL